MPNLIYEEGTELPEGYVGLAIGRFGSEYEGRLAGLIMDLIMEVGKSDDGTLVINAPKVNNVLLTIMAALTAQREKHDDSDEVAIQKYARDLGSRFIQKYRDARKLGRWPVTRVRGQ